MTYTCKICGEELNAETFHYIAWGGMAQGPSSDKSNYTEETFCTNCFTMLKTSILVSISKAIAARKPQDSGGQADPIS